uniref:Uncharacterized protein n=1 Tax=Trichogramma kaykai TaxID=54128 RepID=A0ABD2X8H4_9HYME
MAFLVLPLSATMQRWRGPASQPWSSIIIALIRARNTKLPSEYTPHSSLCCALKYISLALIYFLFLFCIVNIFKPGKWDLYIYYATGDKKNGWTREAWSVFTSYIDFTLPRYGSLIPNSLKIPDCAAVAAEHGQLFLLYTMNINMQQIKSGREKIAVSKESLPR